MIFKWIIPTACFTLLCFSGFAQLSQNSTVDKSIVASEVERVQRTLSADSMEGRKPFTKGIEKAADFIASEFRKAGLESENNSYFQEFDLLGTRFKSASGKLNGKQLESRYIVVRSTEPSIIINENSGYEFVQIGAKDTLSMIQQRLLKTNRNYLITVDTSQVQIFNRLKRSSREGFKQQGNLIYLLTNETPSSYSIEITQEVSPLKLKNVVGIIPGKSKKEEYVIFSAHYDHLGIGKPNKDNDSIYNGANDDASGVTAVITLAKYFSQLKQNERTLIFAAFTAEESGGYGAQYFSGKYPPEKVMAMFNIEMIGTESKWGTNSAFITGFDKSDMGSILQNNLKKTAFRFFPDPYPQQNLFYRSDNATLARLGVPAHTISTAKMDTEKPEPFYHTADDEFETLNMNNMTQIIKSIALSAVSIVSGKETPSRVDRSQLR